MTRKQEIASDPALIQRLKELSTQGLTLKEIANAIGETEFDTEYAMKVNSIDKAPITNNRLLGSEEELSEIKGLYLSGKTPKEIGDAFGVSSNIIRSRLIEIGLWERKKREKIDREELESLRASGKSVKEIAEVYGVKSRCIWDKIDEYGLPKKDVSRIEIPKDELAKMRASGLSIKEIAEHYGVSISTINKNLKEYGLVKEKE